VAALKALFLAPCNLIIRNRKRRRQDKAYGKIAKVDGTKSI
jgi:hypothetical protein